MTPNLECFLAIEKFSSDAFLWNFLIAKLKAFQKRAKIPIDIILHPFLFLLIPNLPWLDLMTLWPITYPLFGQEFSDNGTQHPGERPDSVGETHQDTGEPRGNVQVIHIESYNTQLKVQQQKNHSIYKDIKTIHYEVHVTNSENKYQITVHA